MEKCFAYRLNKEADKFECSCLSNQVCDGCKFGCKFYKTKEQWQKELMTQPQKMIDKFTLIIDGKNHGVFDSIVEIDRYLNKFYLDNKTWEDTWYNGDSDGIDVVFYNHNVKFLYDKEA